MLILSSSKHRFIGSAFAVVPSFFVILHVGMQPDLGFERSAAQETEAELLTLSPEDMLNITQVTGAPSCGSTAEVNLQCSRTQIG